MTQENERQTIADILACKPFASSFAAGHPWVVTIAGVYDSRFTSEQLALEHAHSIGGAVEYDAPLNHAAVRG